MTKDQLIDLIKGELSGIEDLTQVERSILKHIQNYESVPCMVHSFECPSLSAASQCNTNKGKFKVHCQISGEDTARSWIFDNRAKALNMVSWLKATIGHYNVGVVEI